MFVNRSHAHRHIESCKATAYRFKAQLRAPFWLMKQVAPFWPTKQLIIPYLSTSMLYKTHGPIEIFWAQPIGFAGSIILCLPELRLLREDRGSQICDYATSSMPAVQAPLPYPNRPVDP